VSSLIKIVGSLIQIVSSLIQIVGSLIQIVGSLIQIVSSLIKIVAKNIYVSNFKKIPSNPYWVRVWVIIGKIREHLELIVQLFMSL
jgi:hypothetical protein